MQGEIVIKPKWKKIYVYYSHGYHLWFMDKKDEVLKTLQINEDKGTDFRKVFSLRNIFTYYWWKIKQYLFWHNVHKPIGNFIKKHTNLNKTFYPINQ